MKSYICILFTILSAFISGCLTPPVATNRKELGSYTVVEESVKVDDLVPIFSRTFSSENSLGKTKFETDAEYNERILTLGQGIEGRAVTGFVGPHQCDIETVIEKGFYVVKMKDGWYPGSYGKFAPEKFAIAVHESNSKIEHYMAANAFGAQVEVTNYSGEYYRFRPINKPQLMSIMWKAEVGEFRNYGVGFYTLDPTVRAAIKGGRVGLAFKGVIGSLRLAERHYDYTSPKIDNPTKWSYTLFDLPVTITDVWVVNADTMKSYVHWSINALPGGTPAPGYPTVISPRPSGVGK